MTVTYRDEYEKEIFPYDRGCFRVGSDIFLAYDALNVRARDDTRMHHQQRSERRKSLTMSSHCRFLAMPKALALQRMGWSRPRLGATSAFRYHIFLCAKSLIRHQLIHHSEAASRRPMLVSSAESEHIRSFSFITFHCLLLSSLSLRCRGWRFRRISAISSNSKIAKPISTST